MQLDRRALRDLEVFEPSALRPGAPTLFSTLNSSRTPMGARMLRGWLARPLLELPSLLRRQQSVAAFAGDSRMREEVRELLRKVPDLERLLNRVRTFTATPRDLGSLGHGLAQAPALLSLTGGGSNGFRETPLSGLKSCDETTALIQAAIAEDPPVTVGEGTAIRSGFDPQLDELRNLSTDARSSIAAIEAEARQSTGIKSLKVGYNRVFGYYIEVSRANLDRVPPGFERRQTLTGGERFITPELKALEEKILTAGERIAELERSIFRRVCSEISAYGERIMQTAHAIAWLDCVCSLAETASQRGWVRPEVNEEDAIRVREGRHPVVEAALGAGRFVPNDIDLSNSTNQVAIITGPNMSGKSTYIRQVAILALLAQTGSFVPAAEAEFGLVDRIFTRAGLSDDISGGQSTFMVEMIETASILNQATPRSLAVLDEIGRGTSTYDGLAIARAVAEYIHNRPALGCKTLFATHYHEMTALADELPRAVNYRVAVSEDGHEVAFLHRIVPGGADRSYGVHVARLAGLPQPVISRAWQLLDQLERSGQRHGRKEASSAQLPLFGAGHPVINELNEMKVDEMTPLDAISALYRLQRLANEDAQTGHGR
jgi:DNA mismatch repair protein MutS